MGEAKAPVQNFYENVIKLRRADTSLGKPKSFQVEEDKILAEVTLSTI
jgi:hypothetical protein